MRQLTVRCLGGLEVRLGDRQLTSFESNKVKALFAYLLTQRRRSFSREHLAALLWPEKPDEAGRRNLRQAVYNLKSALSPGSAAVPPVVTRGGDLQLNPELDCWLDVEVFEQARGRAFSRGAVHPHYLASAVALYRGDFLTGLSVKGSPDFELWQLTEQERLRSQAIDALRSLVDSHLSRGELRVGLQYARRLVAIDPLSEEAHRYLMRLYSLSGGRSRALSQYEQLCDTLHRELGVEPLAETQALYELILTEQTPPLTEEGEDKGIGPLIPLVGRQEPYRQLRECWHAVLRGRCRLTIVDGEAGIGKHRLVKSFLDAASSRRSMTVLKGECSDLTPTAYQPFGQVLRNAAAEDSQQTRAVLDMTSPAEAADIACLVPELRELRPDLPPAPELRSRADRERLFERIARFLERLCRPAADGLPNEPLVLMLSDLQWAGAETAAMLGHLLERLAAVPVWIVGTCCPAGLGAPGLRALPERHVSRIVLQRLEPAAVDEIALALVGDDQAAELAGFLSRHGQGLPLAIAEWINTLWDEDVLVQEAGHWYLKASLADRSGGLDELIRRRLRRLPDSTRRLAAQAAVMGERFDARLLQKAASEHLRVVEVGLELMLERWLIRQHTEAWRTGRREQDIVLWARGARRGRFEFNHRLIWQSILDDVNPLRRQVMHQKIAEALEADLGTDSERCCELLAFHYAQAGIWDRAIVHLRGSARKARAVLASNTERHYLRQEVEALTRLSGAARQTDEAEVWRREHARSLARLEETEPLEL